MLVYIMVPVAGRPNGAAGNFQADVENFPCSSAGAFKFDCFSLKWQQHRAVNQRLRFPGPAHFPEGLYPGCSRSADNPSFHEAPEEQEIKAQERVFSEGPLDYN